MAQVRRPRLQGMRGRRREAGQVDVFSAERQTETRRDGGVFLHRLQVARPPRSGQQKGHEGPANQSHVQPEEDAF